MSFLVSPVYYPGPRPLTLADVLLFLLYGLIFVVLPALGVTLLIKGLLMKHLKKLFNNKFYKAAVLAGTFVVSSALFIIVLFWIIKTITPRIVF